MKYCSKCGKELFDEAVICTGCGCAVANAPVQNVYAQPQVPQQPQIAQQETSSLATAAIVFAIIMPIVGLILGIIGTVKYKNPDWKGKSTGAIILSIAMWAIYFGLLMMLGNM